MSEPRKPAAFRVEPQKPEPNKPDVRPREPRAVAPAMVTVAEIDVFDEQEAALAVPPPPVARRRSKLGSIFFAALGIAEGAPPGFVLIAAVLKHDGLLVAQKPMNEGIGVIGRCTIGVEHGSSLQLLAFSY